MMFRKAAVALLLARSVVAQTQEERLSGIIKEVRYPPISESARIQSDVALEVDSGKVGTVSGHPLLVPVARDNAAKIGSINGNPKFSITYHFVLIDPTSVPAQTTVRNGNFLERAVWHMTGRGKKAQKTVTYSRCQESIPPSNTVDKLDLAKDSAKAEVTIYGATRCLETETAIVASRSANTGVAARSASAGLHQ